MYPFNLSSKKNLNPFQNVVKPFHVFFYSGSEINLIKSIKNISFCIGYTPLNQLLKKKKNQTANSKNKQKKNPPKDM